MKKLILLYLFILLFSCEKNIKNNRKDADTGWSGSETQMVRPTIVYKGDLIYPDSLKGIRGTVWIQCLIDTTGKILEKTIFKSDNSRLNDAALKTVEGYKFKPSVLNNMKVKSTLTFPIEFN